MSLAFCRQNNFKGKQVGEISSWPHKAGFVTVCVSRGVSVGVVIVWVHREF